MRFLPILLVALLPPLAAAGAGAGQRPLATNAPARIELRDQFDRAHLLAFPATNLTLLAIADEQGSAQVDSWIAALKPRYAGRLDIRGLADCGGAPGFLRGKIRKKFAQARAHPVLLDWSGDVCGQFGYQKGVANLLVIARDGAILARHAGAASVPAVTEAIRTIDRQFAPANVSQASNPPLP